MNVSTNLDELIETLAEVEHQQWLHWSNAVAPEVADATRQKWERSWIDYSHLTEEVKEADRVWARKVVAVLRERQLIS
jgi:hypothetical protein